jgi:hypothetical protein
MYEHLYNHRTEQGISICGYYKVEDQIKETYRFKRNEILGNKEGIKEYIKEEIAATKGLTSGIGEYEGIRIYKNFK